MARTVKLKDIAEELQVSVVTVSNALSGKKGVSDSVREEILKTARKMGYDTSRYEEKEEENSKKIGVIVSEKYLEVGISFYWALYQQVAYAAAKKHSVTILEILDKNVKGERGLPRVISENSVDGLIVIGCIESRYIERILEVSDVPVVLLDFCKEGLPCDAVMSDNYVGMYKSTRYLLDRGHEKVAFVGSVKATENIMERYFGFRKAMEEKKLPLKPEWKIEDRDIETGEVHITLPAQMPTAFVCNSDFTAGHLYDLLRKEGYRVPEDISIVAYDNYLYGNPFANELTTYNVDMEKMARTTIRILLKKIKGKDNHRGIRWIDGEIVERSSVKIL